MATNKTGIVIGLGEFGLHMAKALSENGCEVIAVDISEKRVNAAKNYVMQAMVADATQKDALSQIIIPDVDFIIVGIGNIEKSMITTLYLKEYGFEKLYVKAATDEHEKILKLLGVKNIIFPERDVTRKMASRLMFDNLLDYLPLSSDYSIAEVRPVNNIIGKTLKDINFRKKFDMSVIAVQRPDATKMIFTPGPNYTIGEDDRLMVLGKCDSIDSYNSLIKNA
jgi:trk system potassium uptake protein